MRTIQTAWESFAEAYDIHKMSRPEARLAKTVFHAGACAAVGIVVDAIDGVDPEQLRALVLETTRLAKQHAAGVVE